MATSRGLAFGRPEFAAHFVCRGGCLSLCPVAVADTLFGFEPVMAATRLGILALE